MATIYSDNFEINNIDTVLFDKDGTFLNADLYWGKVVEERILAITKKYDIDKKLFHELCIAMGYDNIKKELTINGPISILSREGVAEAIMKDLRKYGVSTTLNEISDIFNKVHSSFMYNINQYTKIIDGAIDCFELLKQNGLKLAVVTSDTHTHTVEILKYLNIEKYFDAIIGKEDTKEEKKTGQPALLALKLLNSKAEKTITIGDAPMDFLMSKNANLKDAIMVTTGQVPLEELKTLTSNIVNNLRDIKIK